MDVQRRMGRAAAAAAMVLGAAHLAVTGGSLLTGAQEPTIAHLAWVLLPVLVALVFSAAASALASPWRTRGRWALWVGGTAAVSTGALTMGANPISLFLGPGPYALPCAVLFTALALRTVRGREGGNPGSRGSSATPSPAPPAG